MASKSKGPTITRPAPPDPSNGGQNGHCVNRMYRQYTHTSAYTHICAQIGYKRHFYRCSANKEIWLLAAIRRAVIFDPDLVINVVRTVTA